MQATYQKLENTGYRLSESQPELYKTKIEWISHKIVQNRIRYKTKSCKELKEPKKKQKRTEILPGSNPVII